MTQKPFTLAELLAKMDRELAERPAPAPLGPAERPDVFWPAFQPDRAPAPDAARPQYAAPSGIHLDHRLA